VRSGDRVPDIEVLCDAAGPAAVPLYSLLDPSAFTVLATGAASLPLTADSSMVKTVRVQASPDPQHRECFTRSFGDGKSLFAVRPDAYLGYTGPIEDHAPLEAWLAQFVDVSAGFKY
jgi:hypothetical protein